MTKRYLAVYERGTTNYSGYVPDVLGCGSVGDSLEEMRSNMIEALEFHLEGLAEDGIPAPEPVTTNVDFRDDDPEHGVLHCVVEWLEIQVPTPQKLAATA
ncbi:MAG TPA: type II toxin-antitoxin system HicB family antitoxin [Acidobacteriaceae bacterium]